MRATPDTRLEDLGPKDYVAVQCLSCDHTNLLTGDRLKSAGVKYDETIADLYGPLPLPAVRSQGPGCHYYPMGAVGYFSVAASQN